MHDSRKGFASSWAQDVRRRFSAGAIWSFCKACVSPWSVRGIWLRPARSSPHRQAVSLPERASRSVRELFYCPARENVLYAAEGGFEFGFSAQRALGRNRFIHAMGEKTLVAQTGFGKGGTWNGSLDNLQHEYSPLFVFDDGSEGTRALCARGATPVQALTSLQALTPAQLSFDMQ